MPLTTRNTLAGGLACVPNSSQTGCTPTGDHEKVHCFVYIQMLDVRTCRKTCDLELPKWASQKPKGCNHSPARKVRNQSQRNFVTSAYLPRPRQPGQLALGQGTIYGVATQSGRRRTVASQSTVADSGVRLAATFCVALPADYIRHWNGPALANFFECLLCSRHIQVRLIIPTALCPCLFSSHHVRESWSSKDTLQFPPFSSSISSCNLYFDPPGPPLTLLGLA
eukprot:6211987-Pleurochrysis_carterae.AAC.9